MRGGLRTFSRFDRLRTFSRFDRFDRLTTYSRFDRLRTFSKPTLASGEKRDLKYLGSFLFCEKAFLSEKRLVFNGLRNV